MNLRLIVAVSAATLGNLCLAQTPATPAAAAPAGAQATWKLATGYRAESFHTQNIIQFARDVEQATRGQLTIQVHPNNTLAKLNDIKQAVVDGKAEAGETIMTSMVKDISIAGADAVPFVVSSYKDAARLWKLQRPGIEKHFAQRGLTLLYAVPWPPQGLHSSKPIRNLADFKGTQMRTYNSTTLRIAELLGARPVDVAMVDVGKALAEGRMDNMITSAAAADAEARGWAASESLATSATEELRQNGIRIDRIPPDVELEIKRMGEKFSREWVRTVGNEANQIFVPYYLQ